MNIKGFCKEYGIVADVKHADENPNMSDMPAGSMHWKVTIRWSEADPESFEVPFSQGPAHTEEPTVEDVLDCVASDAAGYTENFEEWCDEYGYDTDSRRAERTHRAVGEQTAKLREFLGGDLFEELLYEVERL